MLLAALVLSGCTLYHYVDTCTRSQLLFQGYDQPVFELPALGSKDWRCNQEPAATSSPSTAH